MQGSSGKPMWQRNLFVLWFGVFMSGVAMSEVMPFLSLYVNELGHFNAHQLTLYSSIIYSVSFIAMAVTAPIWGRLADRKGRRLMLIRAAIGMFISFGLMAFVTNIWQLAFLRACSGAFGGYVANANALIAAQTPKKDAGRALGILMTGMTSGTLLGPLLGGTLATIFSYRFTFIITGTLMFIVFILTVGWVKEAPQYPVATPTTATDEPTLAVKSSFGDLIQNRLILILFITTMFVQIVNMSISPILSLYVRQLNANPHTISFVAGLVAAMPGIATVIAAPRFGRFGDKIGSHKIAFFGFSLALVTFFVTSFAPNIPTLMSLRFITGIADAAILPAVNSLLTKNSTVAQTSLVFAYNQSFQAFGAMLGPLIGAVVANATGYSGVFISSSILMIINLSLFMYARKRGLFYVTA